MRELRPQASVRIGQKCSSQQVTGSLSIKKCFYDVTEMMLLVQKSQVDQLGRLVSQNSAVQLSVALIIPSGAQVVLCKQRDLGFETADAE